MTNLDTLLTNSQTFWASKYDKKFQFHLAVIYFPEGLRSPNLDNRYNCSSKSMAESTLSQVLVMSLSHGPVTLTNVHISTSWMPAVTKLRQKILLWEIIMGHLSLSATGFIFTWSHDINKSIYLNFWRGYGHQIWTKRRFLGRDFNWQRKVLKFRIIEELRGPTFDTRYICSGGVQHGILPFVRLLHDPAK